MLTDTGGSGAAVFLLAHQDDEFGIFEAMRLALAAGRQLRVCYFTTGVRLGLDPGPRNRESLRVLRSIGVREEDVSFAGEELNISDGALSGHMERAANWLVCLLGSMPVEDVYVTAWEGGHPDHDSLCAIAALVCAELGLVGRLRQFPLYNGYRCSGPWFRVLSPLSENGPVSRSRIPWGQRLTYLRYCLAYPSQWRSWIGLFPFVALRYALHGTQDLQPVAQGRIGRKPHDGRLYYERRQFSDWETVHRGASAFMVRWKLGDRPLRTTTLNPGKAS